MAEAEAYIGDLRDKNRRNWVKCTLGLQELANAVKGHVQKTFDNYFYNVNTFLSRDCCHQSVSNPSTCPHKNSEGYCECCHGGHKGNCSQHVDDPCHHVIYKKGRWKLSVSCKACESALAQLQKLINGEETANWDNIYFPDVFKNPWAVAKIFMPRRNGDTDNPDQADAQCLLTIMKKCNLFNIDDYLLEQVVKARNKMIHRDALMVSDQATRNFYKMAIAFLDDLQQTNNYNCESHIERLKELENMAVTAEMYDKAIENDIQGLLNNIKDRLANGENAEELVERLRTAIQTQTKQSLEKENATKIRKKEEEIERITALLNTNENVLQMIKDQLRDTLNMLRLSEERNREYEVEIEHLKNAVREKDEKLEKLTNENEVQCQTIRNLVTMQAEFIIVVSILVVIFLTICLRV